MTRALNSFGRWAAEVILRVGERLLPKALIRRNFKNQTGFCHPPLYYPAQGRLIYALSGDFPAPICRGKLAVEIHSCRRDPEPFLAFLLRRKIQFPFAFTEYDDVFSLFTKYG